MGREGSLWEGEGGKEFMGIEEGLGERTRIGYLETCAVVDKR